MEVDRQVDRLGSPDSFSVFLHFLFPDWRRILWRTKKFILLLCRSIKHLVTLPCDKQVEAFLKASDMCAEHLKKLSNEKAEAYVEEMNRLFKAAEYLLPIEACLSKLPED